MMVDIVYNRSTLYETSAPNKTNTIFQVYINQICIVM